MVSKTFRHPTSLGEVVLRAVYGDDGADQAVEILQADPRVLISAELLRQLRNGQNEPSVPFATIDKVDIGGVLRIHGSNRQLVYVLTEYEPMLADGFPARDAYAGEWPD